MKKIVFLVEFTFMVLLTQFTIDKYVDNATQRFETQIEESNVFFDFDSLPKDAFKVGK